MGQRISSITFPRATVPPPAAPLNVTRKALLIGINYTGSEYALHGCINDVNNIKTFLMTEYGLQEEDIMVLTDETDLKPTRQSILDSIDWLTNGATSTSRLFLHYSGHGTSLKNVTNSESDGMDECICPVDYMESGFIADDELRVRLVDKLPSGSNLFSIFDCCHSGTILDLKYNYLFSSVPARTEYRMTLQRTTKVTKANVTLLSGCLDNQTSADAYLDSLPQGAMTYSFLKAYALLKKNNKAITCKQLMKTLNTCISKFTQKPKVSTGRSSNLSQQIIIL